MAPLLCLLGTVPEVIKKLHRCLYFIINQKWAVSETFEPFVKCVAELGVDDFKHHLETADKTAMYLSSTIVTEMIENIGDFIERSLVDSLQGKLFSLLADESTDKQNRTQLSVFCRWNDSRSVQDHFMGLIQLDRTRAEDCMRALEVFFTAKGINLTDLRFMGFDGCNTMSGEQKGLQRRMRHVSPLAVYINCRNHRLALCLKHLTKDFPLLDEVDKTLLSVWKMFNYSPQKMSAFVRIQEVYGQRPLSMIRASMIRWLSHLRASSRIIKCYEPLVDTLDSIYDDSKDPEVYGIRHNVVRKDIVAMIILLCDVLTPVNFLSLYLQESQVNFTFLDCRVKQTVDELRHLITKYESGNYQDTEFRQCQDLYQMILERTDLARRLRNDLENDYSPAHFLQQTGVPFINMLIAEIEHAFDSSPLLNAFGVLDPRNLPDLVQDIPEYGDEAINTLAEVYAAPAQDTYQGHVTVVPADFDSKQVVVTELRAFMRQLFMMKQRSITTVAAVHMEMSRDDVMKDCFPRVYSLLTYSLLIPASTAVVERGFNLMNDICGPLRSRLTQSHLTSLMRIVSEGPPELSDEQLNTLLQTFKLQKKIKIQLE